MARTTAMPRYTTKHINALIKGAAKTDTRITENIKIEKNIPIPDISTRKAFKYPLLAMETGDSFTVHPDRSRSVRGAIHRAQVKTRNKFRFATRIVMEGKKELLRIWRTS